MTAIAKDNIAYTACNDIKLLLGDSFRSLELVNFFYARHYNDGKCYLMTTIPEVIDFDLQYDIQFVPSIPSEMLSSKFHYLVPYDGMYSELISKFNTWHPINIIFREKGYFDVFCFTSLRNDNQQVNRHLNNLSAYHRIITEFKNKASKLLNNMNMQSHTFHLDKKYRPNFTGFERNPRIKLLNNNHLTQREMQCVQQLATGKNNIEIANTLHISARTVETHFNHIKEKLECKKRSDIISTLQLLQA